MMKIVPWGISGILALLCLYQQQTIASLEEEKTTLSKEIIQASAKKKITKPGTKSSAKYNNSASMMFKNNKKKRGKKKAAAVSGETSNSLANDDLDILVEERAWERVAEIEEEQFQERMDHISERIQQKVSDWSEQFEWSEETETQVAEILISTMKERMEMQLTGSVLLLHASPPR